MAIMQRFKNAFNAFRTTSDLNEEMLLEWLGIAGTRKKVLSEVTYFTCLRMLGETLGKLPIKFYKQTDNGRIRAPTDDRFLLLNQRPNRNMSASTFWATVENNRNHHGNAYVWIQTTWNRSGRFASGYTQNLWIMQSEYVTVTMDDKGIFGDKGLLYYQYSDPYTGESYIFKYDDVMHFKTSVSFDGITGQPVRKILEGTVNGALESQSFMNKLYEQGLTASMALQHTGELDQNTIDKLQKKYEKLMTGSANAGRIVPIPKGFQLTPLTTKLTDAQFFDLKKYTALQIAGAFGIKPNQINNYEKSSYQNSESQQIAFLVDTMLYNIKHYEDEINYKMLTSEERKNGLYFKFNEKAILRTDSKTQMENLAKGVNNGIYTVNDAREYLDKPWIEGGDMSIVNGNYIKLIDVGNQYTKGGVNNE